MTHIILASSSTYRKQQLEQLSITPHQCLSPNIDESALPSESTANRAKRLARLKVQAVENLPANQFSNREAIIIGGDQTASTDTRHLDKPYSREHAIEQLIHCSEKSAVFYSAYHLINTKTQESFEGCIPTQVTFRKLSIEEIERYIDKDMPLNCAGSFKCEGLGISLFRSIKSNDPSALVGFPLIAINQALISLNYNTLLQP